MRVRYVCDSCREVILDLVDPSLTEARLGLDVLTAEERSDFVTEDAGTVVLSILCDECVALLRPEWTEKTRPFLH